jgi:CRISPR/Cas system-associated exonuclease Cas4 (RecB family)
MKELEMFAKDAVIDAFDMCDSEKICKQCPYKRICYET